MPCCNTSVPSPFLRRTKRPMLRPMPCAGVRVKLAKHIWPQNNGTFLHSPSRRGGVDAACRTNLLRQQPPSLHNEAALKYPGSVPEPPRCLLPNPSHMDFRRISTFPSMPTLITILACGSDVQLRICAAILTCMKIFGGAA